MAEDKDDKEGSKLNLGIILTNTVLISAIPILFVIGYNTYFGVLYDTNISFINQAIYVLNVNFKLLAILISLSLGACIFLIIVDKFGIKEPITRRSTLAMLLYSIFCINIAYVLNVIDESKWWVSIVMGGIYVIVRVLTAKSFNLISIPSFVLLSFSLMVVFLMGYNIAEGNNFYLAEKTENKEDRKQDEKIEAEKKARIIMLNNGQALVKWEDTEEIAYVKIENKYVIIEK